MTIQKREVGDNGKRFAAEAPPAMVPIGMVRFANDETGKIESCNEKAAAFLDIEHDQGILQEASIFSFIPTMDRETLIGMGESGPISFSVTGSDGTQRWIEAYFDLAEADAAVGQVWLIDVTAQKEQEIYNALIQHIQGGILISTYRDGRLWPEFFSKGFAKMLGLDERGIFDFYQNGMENRVFDDDYERAMGDLDQNLDANSDSWESVFRVERGDGIYIWVKCISSIISKENGQIKLCSICNDISQEIKEQQDLREKYNEMLFKHYKNLAPGEILSGHCNVTRRQMIDLAGTTDHDLLNSFGFDRDEFFSGLAGLIPNPDEQKQFREMFLSVPLERSYERGEFSRQMECFAKLPGEEQGRYVRAGVSLIRSPETGDIMGFLSLIDITEEKISKQVLSRLVKVSYDFIIEVDISNDYFKWISANEEIYKKYFAESCFSDAGKLIIDEEVLPKDREYCQTMLSPSYIRHRMENQESYSFHYDIEDEHGEIRTKNLLIFSVDPKLDRVCLVRSDITDVLDKEQKSKEELRGALDIAQDANRAKSQFLSAMSHDIRTPMNAIIGMTDLALSAKDDREQVEQSLEVIKTSSEHLLRLINDILDMSRIESGKMTLAKEPYNQKKEIDIFVEQRKIVAEKNGLDFTYKIDIKHEACIGDALNLIKILDNLIGNAFKFTPEGGKITLEVKELNRKSPDQIRWYRYTVSDNGIGMEKESLEHIYEPFFRTESSMISRTEGSGLGLSIVKNIVDYRGGTIDVKSSKDKGTTFCVELPIQIADTVAREVTPSKEKPNHTVNLKNMHILLVEDNHLNQMIAAKLLMNGGAKVTTAVDGKEGVEMFTKSPEGDFDLILMDIQMPRMNGYEATEFIRSSDHPQAATIPIIAMTANVFAGDIKACMDAGMNDHIGKPIDLKKLYITLDKYRNK